MTFTVPAARVARTLYNSAKRVRDELGKGQEVLRIARLSVQGVPVSGTRHDVFIPDVDIVVTEIKTSSDGFDDGDVAEVLALANGEDYTTAAAAANRLVATMDLATEVGEDTFVRQTLLGLNGNKVRAGQPIVLKVIEDASAIIPGVYAMVSYILADEERSY